MNLKEGYIKEPAGATRRFCQFIKLNPDTLGEYKYWHESKNIWKEIPQGIRRAGILDMEVYVTGDNGIMILTTPVDFDWDKAFGSLASFERQAEWEEFMAPYQVATGARSDEKWQLCERAFSLTDALKTAEKE